MMNAQYIPTIAIKIHVKQPELFCVVWDMFSLNILLIYMHV